MSYLIYNGKYATINGKYAVVPTVPLYPYPTDGLVARWDFANTLVDTWGGYTLVPVGTGPTYIDGDRTTTVMRCGSRINLLNNSTFNSTFTDGKPWTVCLWLSLLLSTGKRGFTLGDTVGSSNYSSSYISGESAWLSFMNVGGYGVSGNATSVSNNSWHQIIISFENNYFYSWFDLTAKDAVNMYGSWPNDKIKGMALGANDNYTDLWLGRFDSIYIYNRVLTSAERTQLYNGGTGI